MAVSVKKEHHTEQDTVEQIQQGDSTAFEKIFFKYHTDLCFFALKIVENKKGAEDVVQNVFLNIWKNRQEWEINVSLEAYLYRAVKNRAINYSKKQNNYRKKKNKYLKRVETQSVPSHENKSDPQDTVSRIWEIVDAMPKRRSLVFTLHRKHGLRYKEIAQIMDITRKTVENHMGYALKQIRKEIDAAPFTK